MPKYLFQANYTHEGLKGLLAEGGSSRKKAVKKAIEGLGGKMEAFYYSFGYADVLVIAELPDNIAATALSLITNAAGTAQVKTIVLITPEEVDESVKKSVDYRPPGQ